MSTPEYFGIPPDDMSEGESKLWHARRLNSDRLRREARALLKSEGKTDLLRDLDDEEEARSVT